MTAEESAWRRGAGGLLLAMVQEWGVRFGASLAAHDPQQVARRYGVSLEELSHAQLAAVAQELVALAEAAELPAW